MGAGIAKPVQTATQNMGGKGSAGGSAAPTTTPQSGMGGKGYGQQPQPQVQQPKPGMGNKGVGQQPTLTASNLQMPFNQWIQSQNQNPNAPAKTTQELQQQYMNEVVGQQPQPQVQQPKPGMGGKGVGQPMNNPNVPQAEIDALQGLTPGSPAYMDQVKYLGSLGYNAAPTQPQAGMGGKGGPAQMTPEQRAYISTVVRPVFPTQPGLAQMQQDLAQMQQMQQMQQPGLAQVQQPMPPKPTVQGPISSGGIPTPNNPILGGNTPQQDAMRQRFMNQFGQRQVGGAPFEQRIGQEDQRQMIQRMLQQRGNR